MGLFGSKKPTIFDKDQNKALQALATNQQILVTNNDHFIKTHKDLWKWINHFSANDKALLKRISTLEATIKSMKARDEKIEAALATLSSIASPPKEPEAKLESI